MRRCRSRVEEGPRSVGRTAPGAPTFARSALRSTGVRAATVGAGAEPGGYRWPHWFWAVLPVVAACLWLASAS